MKILIVYALAGIGHRRAAEALYKQIKDSRKDCQVSIVDSLEYSNRSFSFFYTNGYFFLVKYLPTVWKFLYLLTHEKDLYFITKKVRRMINFINTKEFADFLIKENPDIVISTHMLAGEVISDLKRGKKINPRLINVITDFSAHPFWVDTGIDEYIVALEYTKRELLRMGIEDNKIKVLGIPVDSNFTKQYDKPAVREKLGLRQDNFTVLIMTGAIGIGPIERIADALNQDAQLLVVCGRNDRLLRRLERKNYPALKLFGIADNIEELMAAADVILTKPGGLSASESLSMGLPMVFIIEIPGQESKNAEVLCNYNVSWVKRDIRSIRDTVLKLKNCPQELESARDNITRIRKPFAAKDICDEVCKGCGRPAC